MNGNKPYSILIVDDEVHNIDVLCQILNPTYTVKTAKSGQAAIKMALKHSPDLILLDVIMPDMSGFEVLSELKASDLTREIPVIFITGLDNSQDEEKGLRLGAVDYITKPFHNSIVKLRVKTHLKIIEQMRTIERLGMIDALTNIPNRRSFDHQLNVEWNRSKRAGNPLSILMLDVDKFKHFNDNYGHAHGDEALKTVAKVTAQTLRRSSDFVARWGGEEFAVLLPGTDLHGALDMAEQIRKNIECAPIPCANGLETKVTVSIGVSSGVPEAGAQIDEFVAKADKALYLAKEEGRNRVRAYS